MNSNPEIRLLNITYHTKLFSLYANGYFFPGIHLLTGKVGSGKTTLGEMLAGIRKPNQGTIEWSGNKRVMLMQDTSYHISTVTVREEAASWHGDTDTIITLSGLCGKEDLDLFGLSRGELRRLELAAILTGEYDLIILDEPYAGLDTSARQWVSQLIQRHELQVIIIISHDITSLPSIDVLWEMDNGTLTCIGKIPDALNSWSRPPPLIKYLISKGIAPTGLSRRDLEEAACKIRG